MASKKKSSGKTKKRAQRATSNVFAMFDQSQIQEFKEAFNLIDQNHDGFIDKEDLHDMLASMGKNPSDKELEDMVNEVPGSINFTMFLTMFGEKLSGTDPEETILNAFILFDEEKKGYIQEDYLTNLLMTRGDHFTNDEIDAAYKGAPIDDEGNLDYGGFVRMIKYGTQDESLVKSDI